MRPQVHHVYRFFSIIIILICCQNATNIYNHKILNDIKSFKSIYVMKVVLAIFQLFSQTISIYMIFFIFIIYLYLYLTDSFSFIKFELIVENGVFILIFF